MFTTKSIFATLLSAATILGAPTPTTGNDASSTVSLTGVTHSVVAGRGGKFIFDPENVVASVGDVIEWHFLPKNHSIAQSNFKQPCQPDPASLSTSFFSGFQPIAEGQSKNVFQIVVKDTKPIWYYCAQNTGRHCQTGMSGVINQNFDGQATLAAYKAAAALTNTSVVPAVVQGGKVIPNPNPLAGF